MLDPAHQALADRLGHRFDRPELLRLALTHRSWCAEHDDDEDNERLEFLGDAVLGLVVTDHLYRDNVAMAEGGLAKARAAVVSSEALADTAADLGLGEALLLGKGEDATGGRTKRSILADALEAVIGAVYLDGGIDAVRRSVLPLLTSRIDAATAGPGDADHKTRLQELSAREFGHLPRYEVEGTGPDHDRQFSATVLIDGRARGEGRGRSKKEAEQAAARAALAAHDPHREPADA